MEKTLDLTEKKNNFTAVSKFSCCSGFGIFMFLCPLNGTQEGFTTGLSLLTDMLDKFLQQNIPGLLTAIVAISALSAVIALFNKPKILKKYKWLYELIVVSKTYLLTRIIALIITICVVFKMGPVILQSDSTGAGMISLSQTLIAIAVVLSFILPFLTDCGIMEFTGILLKPLIRPLFRVPGRASVDLIASWLASSNTAVLITAGQYNSGFYSKREAATIMTNFSLVSIPFCMVVAQTLNITEHFLLLYSSVTIIGLLLAVIGARLYPLGNLPDSYRGEKKINEEVPKDSSLFRWAMLEALQRADQFSLKKAMYDGIKMTIGILMDLIPIVIAWGTIGSLLVNETPIFHWIAYPMGAYMNLLGIDNAFNIAPATLVGFIDMFIPALITNAATPEKTRFIIAGLSLVQIVYLTEVGSIIVKSNVGLNLKRLFIIFLERTIIALPLLALVAKLL